MKSKLFFALHLFFMAYSMSGIVGKLAAKERLFSLPFFLYFGLNLMIMVFYAIGWQQFLKRMPLSAAYANKAVTVVWGCIWGIVFFHEQLTVGKAIGALLVLCGVAFYGYTDGKAAKPKTEKGAEPET